MRKYSKYSDELILESVLSIIQGDRSIAETAVLWEPGRLMCGVWSLCNRQHGAAGQLKREGSYSGDFKLHVIADRRGNNLSLMETITKYAIPSESTLLKWERIYSQDGVEGIYA